MAIIVQYNWKVPDWGAEIKYNGFVFMTSLRSDNSIHPSCSGEVKEIGIDTYFEGVFVFNLHSSLWFQCRKQ